MLEVRYRHYPALLGLAGLLSGSAMALGQQPPGANPPPAKPAPPQQKPAQAPALDQMIADALRHNPDIRIAESKVHEAEAVLNQTRLQVIQKIVTIQHALEAQRALVHLQEQQLRRCEQLHQTNAVPDEVVEAARQKLTAAKGKLSEIEAELPYLLGKQDAVRLSAGLRLLLKSPRLELQPSTDFEAATLSEIGKAQGPGPETLADVLTAASARLGPMAERIRKALDTPVTAETTGAPLAEVLGAFERHAPGVTFRILDSNGLDLSNTPINLRLNGRVPLGAALQAVQDSLGAEQVGFVVRDYGILVAPKDRIPPGAVSVERFWKAGHAQDHAKDAATDPTKPSK
jgi:hypothetical protein